MGVRAFICLNIHAQGSYRAYIRRVISNVHWYVQLGRPHGYPCKLPRVKTRSQKTCSFFIHPWESWWNNNSCIFVNVDINVQNSVDSLSLKLRFVAEDLWLPDFQCPQFQFPTPSRNHSMTSAPSLTCFILSVWWQHWQWITISTPRMLSSAWMRAIILVLMMVYHNAV